MEAHREIPPEYYGRWWKVVNEEFGEIINDDETVQSDDGEAEVNAQEESQTPDTNPQPTAVEADRTRQQTQAPPIEQQPQLHKNKTCWQTTSRTVCHSMKLGRHTRKNENWPN